MTLIELSTSSSEERISRIRRGIVQSLREPSKDDFQVAAHRGLRWHGAPDNSLMAIRRAARTGCGIVEVDIRLTRDNHVVVFHDDFLGRCTNIAEMMDQAQPYSPFTGRGFNPAVETMPWGGMLEYAALKDEFGHITSERLLDLEALLNVMDEEEIPVVLFLDFKDKATVKETWNVLEQRTNTAWIDYCIWKIDSEWYPLPSDLESCRWYRTAHDMTDLMILPVFRPAGCAKFDYMRSLKAYAEKPYVITVEIGLRGPGGFLQDAVDYISSGQSPVRSMGCFATYGDMPPKTGASIVFELDPKVDLWDMNARSKSALSFVENGRPEPFDASVSLRESPDGHDHRADIDLYRSMGYTWTITDAADILLTRLREVSLSESNVKGKIGCWRNSVQ